MLRTTATKLHVLIVEDNSNHAEQIKQSLGTDQYECEVIKDPGESVLLNYKALHPRNQLVIVDLILQGERLEEAAGLKTIHKLWGADRTTFFIVFSEFADAARITTAEPVQPYYSWVQKHVVEGTKVLTKECLDHLRDVVNDLRRCSSPLLASPTCAERSLELSRDISLYCAKLGVIPDQIEYDFLQDTILRSTETVDACVKAASTYERAGLDTKSIGIGIYGSYGRLEAREKSDVEFVVYYDDPEEIPITGSYLPLTSTKQLAGSFWNRLARFLDSKALKIEDVSSFIDPNSNLLDIGLVSDRIEDKYLPIISVQSLLKSGKDSVVQRRSFQIVTELNPVFNPDLIYSMKVNLLNQLSGGVNTVDAFAREIHDVTVHYYMDARPNEVANASDVKKFVFRTLNIISLKIWLAGCLVKGKSQDRDLQNNERCREFLSELSAPGIVKLMRFGVMYFEKFRDQTLVELLNRFVKSYASVMSQFDKLEKTDVQESDITECRLKLMECIDYYVTLNQAIEACDHFNMVKSSLSHKWLLADTEVRLDMQKALAKIPANRHL